MVAQDSPSSPDTIRLALELPRIQAGLAAEPPSHPPREIGSAAMKSASRLTMLVAGIVFVLALAQLKYVASATLWDLSRREAVILTILGVAVCALVSASLYVDAPVLPLIATFAAFYIWGQVFYDGESRYAGFELGYASARAIG